MSEECIGHEWVFAEIQWQTPHFTIGATTELPLEYAYYYCSECLRTEKRQVKSPNQTKGDVSDE